MVGTSFTPRSLLALSRQLVHEPPGRLIGLCGPPRRPMTEVSEFTADIDQLLGFSAPPHWNGLAIVACGSSTPGSHLHVAYLLDRHGHQAITVADDDGEVLASTDTSTSGYIADVCRRVLGLPCQPEARTVGEWAMAQWLTRLLDIAADPVTAHAAAGWPLVAMMHPAYMSTLGSSPDELAEATIDTIRELPWPVLRRKVADGMLFIEAMPADVAGWMDDAFFARFLIEEYRSVDELLDDLRLFLDGDTLEAVTATVDATLSATLSRDRDGDPDRS